MYKARYNNYNKTPKIIIFSGAGLSAESGISTFRDSNGLWENHKIEEICNEFTWKSNFSKVHNFYNQRRVQLASVQPNEAHRTIKRMFDKFGDDLIVCTQNVDDMLERTGIPRDNILHLHGFLTEMQCTACGHNWNIGYSEFNIETDRCPRCGSLKGVKPSIVFFNSKAPMYTYLYRALDYLEHPDSKIIIVGTLGNIICIDQLIKHINPNKKILNNLDKSEYIDDKNYKYVFYEPATTALPKIEELLKDWRNK